ncbi:MAG: phosphate signaling complex protein PhoU [Rubrimonas sp.]
MTITHDTHTLRAFDEALAELSAMIVLMGDRTLAMLTGAGQAFRDHDLETARATIAHDLEIDRMKGEINALVMKTIARFQPLAVDLRQILAIDHMATNLERVADHAKGIAKRVIASSDARPSTAVSALLDQLHDAAAGALREVLGALKREDPARSAAVLKRDDRIDALYDDLFHTAVAELQGGSASALADVQALFIGKSLERVGDHATNIAEEIRFMTLGEAPNATRTA